MGTVGQNIQDRTEKLSFSAIIFSVADTFVGFCDSANPISILGISCAPTPAMEIDFPKNTGVFDTKALTVKLPYVFGGFSHAISSGEPMPEIKAKAYKYYIDAAGSASDVFLGHKGIVAKAAKNPDGQSGVVEVSVIDQKGLLDIPMGIITGAQCAWSFGSDLCKVFVNPLAQDGVIRALSGKSAIIAPDTGTSFVVTPNANQTTAGVQKYWHKGFIFQKDKLSGAHVTIRDWDAATPGEFETISPLPLSWLNTEVTIYPGCDRYIQTCRERWDNELYFSGMGIAVPTYEPEVEGS